MCRSCKKCAVWLASQRRIHCPFTIGLCPTLTCYCFATSERRGSAFGGEPEAHLIARRLADWKPTPNDISLIVTPGCLEKSTFILVRRISCRKHLKFLPVKKQTILYCSFADSYVLRQVSERPAWASVRTDRYLFEKQYTIVRHGRSFVVCIFLSLHYSPSGRSSEKARRSC